MAEKRCISKVISISKKVNLRLDNHFARLLYTWMIPHADDFGRLQGSPHQVRGIVTPMLPETWEDVEQALKELAEVKLIQWYEVDGEQYIQLINFEEHQSGLHKRTKSKFPEFPGISGNFREIPSELKGTELNRTEGKGIGREGKDTPAPDDDHIKDRLLALINQMNIQGFTLFHLDTVYSYIGVADVEVIEACIKKSQNKPHSYLTNTLDGIINKDGIKKKEHLPGANGNVHHLPAQRGNGKYKPQIPVAKQTTGSTISDEKRAEYRAIARELDETLNKRVETS